MFLQYLVAVPPLEEQARIRLLFCANRIHCRVPNCRLPDCLASDNVLD